MWNMNIQVSRFSPFLLFASFLRRSLCVLVVIAVVTPAAADVLPAGYWKFDEGSGTATADSSGHGNAGTLIGSPAWSTGRSGSAVNFNNLNSYVKVDPGASLANLPAGGGVTVMAWIKAASNGEGGGGRI